LYQYWSLSSLGLEIGVSLGVGVVLGWLLDRFFGTSPLCTIAGSLLGIIAGFRSIIMLARKDWDETDGSK
jgi:ATP synthase protein I